MSQRPAMIAEMNNYQAMSSPHYALNVELPSTSDSRRFTTPYNEDQLTEQTRQKLGVNPRSILKLGSVKKRIPKLITKDSPSHYKLHLRSP